MIKKLNCSERLVNDTCVDTADCSSVIPNSECLNQRCTCLTGYSTRSSKRKNCYKNELEQTCRDDSECSGLEHAECVESGGRKKCMCNREYAPRDGKCEAIRLGDLCTLDDQCSQFLTGTVCRASRCSCRDGFVNETINGCRPRRIGDTCRNRGECSQTIKEGTCLGGVCRCNKGYRNVSENECAQNLIGDACSKPEDCQTILGSKKCINKICTCDTSSLPSANGTECKTKVLGDPCERDNECNSTFSACLNKTCSCIFTHKFKDLTHCLPKTLNDSCTSDKECQFNGSRNVCGTDKKCQCQEGFIFQNATWTCTKALMHELHCTNDAFCKRLFNNTVCEPECSNDKPCQPRTCQCAERYFRNAIGECEHNGLNCRKDQECLFIKGSTCVNFTCTCDAAHTMSSDNTSCVLKKVGEIPCNSDLNCAYHNSFCNASVCACKVGYYPSSSYDECLPKKLSDHCDSNDDCLVNNEYSYCPDISNRTCQCLPGHSTERSVVSNKDICVKRVLGQHTCEVEEDCLAAIANSTCNSPCSGATSPTMPSTPSSDTDLCSRTCLCQRGFSQNGTQCRPIKLHTRCTDSSDCLVHVSNSRCGPGICVCQPGYKARNPILCQKYALGDQCRTNEDCHMAVSDSECIDSLNNSKNVCTCKQTHLPDSSNTVCNVKLIGGLSCVTHQHCIPNSFCNDSLCACNVGYFPNSNFDECLPKKLSDPCDTSDDCLVNNEYSYCNDSSNSTCQCLLGYSTEWSVESKKQICVPRVLGNHTCQVQEDCLAAISNSRCGFCSDAPNGSDCERRMCRSTAATPVTTSAITTLIDGHCSDRTCLCQYGFVVVSNRTEKWCRPMQLNDQCHQDNECRVHIPGSQCRRNYCQCQAGHRAINSTFCQKFAIGDQCSLPENCKEAVNNSDCLTNDTTNQKSCTCLSGYHGIQGSRECKRRQIGDTTCRLDADCSDSVNNSVCKNNTCVCLAGHRPDHTLFECLKMKLGSFCNRAIDCSAAVGNSTCNGNFCACMPGFRQVGEEICLQRRIEADCSNSVDCSAAVDNSDCVQGECRCLPGYYDDRDKTLCTRRQIHSLCLSSIDCREAVVNSDCINETCACNIGYYSLDNRTCLARKLFHSCLSNEDCWTVGNSHCESNTCSCSTEYEALSDYQTCVK
ncbi:cell death abnormality protein 1, partial [Biomphalaria pfeifferi]